MTQRDAKKKRTASNRVFRNWLRESQFVASAAIGLFVVLALFGGASRNEIIVQPLVQCCAVLIGAAVLMVPPQQSAPKFRPLAILLAAFAGLMAVQLLPLPPSLWQNLPGHRLETEISNTADLASVWRPISIVPDGGLSALLGIIVPSAVMIVVTRLPFRQMHWAMCLIIGTGALSLMIEIGQIITRTGVLFFYEGEDGTVSGLFNNRNHAAIFLATLPPILAYLALEMRDKLNRREPLWAAFSMALALDAFGVLLTASRIGAVVFLLCSVGAAAMIWTTKPQTRARVARPMSANLRKAYIAVSFLFVAALAVTLLTVSETSLTRLWSTKLEAEGRIGLWVPLFDLAGKYLPFGSGFGTFDRAYRMVEPNSMLQLSYLNHAHNDFIEILIEGGIFSALLLIAAGGLAARATIRAWRAPGSFSAKRDAARAGSVVMAGLLVGSTSDYPLRTPALAAWMTLCLCLLLAFHSSIPQPNQISDETGI